MGYLDNSGDIIVDVVLTDEGRFRLAKGDFKIVKWGAGDTEINYGLYNKTHPSGSAYYDISILRNNILYLPVLKLNELTSENKRHSSLTFVVAVDETTEDDLLSVAYKR